MKYNLVGVGEINQMIIIHDINEILAVDRELVEGVNKEYINGSLRISLGKYNSENDISSFIDTLKILLVKRRGY